MNLSLVLAAALATGTAPATPDSAPPASADPSLVKIGMVQTLFTDVPTPIVNLLTPPFKSLMKDFTGLNGQPMAGGDAFEIAKGLMNEEIHLGVFHGVEFAWVSQMHPDLKPLMIAVSKYPALKGHLIVRGDAKAADFADLKGKELAVPFRAREHLRLFIEKQCRATGQCDPKSYFGQVTKTPHAEAALDDVLSGKMCAAIVDTLALESYAEVKPGCYKRLKTLQESEPFPTAVVVYKQGALSDATLGKFRQGMMSANKSDRGRDLMSLWKLTSFEPVPADYLERCAEIMRAYPAPIPATAVSRPASE